MEKPHIPIAFLIESFPIVHTAIQKPDVDVIKKVRRIDPSATAVVDLKSQVRCREVLFLYSGKICSNDICIREFVREVSKDV